MSMTPVVQPQHLSRKAVIYIRQSTGHQVLTYESTRLSRNCTDWYPLLDLCAYNQCLIADRDGVYDASTPNGRLLLGMKGIVSEVELHTLRGRLIAGVQQKAQRGE